MALIELSNIEFSYERENGDHFKLKDISLEINSGEFVVILGPNGSGKSTLLKLISGVISPGKGAVSLAGRTVKKMTPKEIARLIAFVPQDTFTIFPFSVYEIVMMGRTPYLNLFGMENETDHQIVADALEMVGITHLKNKGINEVSGGEAQRAFLARALVQQPKIILLDEPNAHLDIKHQIAFFDLLKKLNREEGLTVIAISHDLNLSAYYAERAILMQNGEVFMDDSKDRVLTENNIKKIFDVNTIVTDQFADNSLHILINPNN